MYREYNPNPAARRTIDCAVRALCRVTGGSWEQIHGELCELSRQMCTMPSANEVWGAFLRRDGWRRYAIPNSCPDGYTVEDFAADHPFGEYIVGCSGHVIAVCFGDVYDTWDSSREIPMFYWERSDE